MPLVTFERRFRACPRRSAAPASLLAGVDARLDHPMELYGVQCGDRLPGCNFRVSALAFLPRQRSTAKVSSVCSKRKVRRALSQVVDPQVLVITPSAIRSGSGRSAMASRPTDQAGTRCNSRGMDDRRDVPVETIAYVSATLAP